MSRGVTDESEMRGEASVLQHREGVATYGKDFTRRYVMVRVQKKRMGTLGDSSFFLAKKKTEGFSKEKEKEKGKVSRVPL